MTTEWQLSFPPTIRGARVVLRAPEDADADAAVDAVLESVRSGRFVPWARAGYARGDALRWIARCRDERARGVAFEYLFVDEHERILGSVGLSAVNRAHRVANLGYWIRTSVERRGFTTDAARALARAGLEAGLERVEILAEVGNVASQRVAEKAGATREGVLRSRLFSRGEARDAVIFSLTRRDLGRAALDSASASL